MPNTYKTDNNYYFISLLFKKKKNKRQQNIIQQNRIKQTNKHKNETPINPLYTKTSIDNTFII